MQARLDAAAAQLSQDDAALAQAQAQNAQLAQTSGKALQQAQQDAQQRADQLASAEAAVRDRDAQLARAQQENAAISQRLRQAQGTLDQIVATARLLNGGSAPPPAATSANAAPAVSAAALEAGRTYVVAENDSLSSISLRFYGTAARWQDIYKANLDVLENESMLHTGQRLKIP